MGTMTEPAWAWDDRVDGYTLWGSTDYSGSYLETPEDPATRDPEHGRDYYVIGWTEYLDWHLDYYGPVLRAMTTAEDEDDPESPRWLTDEAERAILEVVREYLYKYMRDELVVEDASVGGDDPSFTLSTTIRGNLDKRAVTDRAWAFTAALANLTDPGTYGVPYLFSEVARRLGLDAGEMLREAEEGQS